MVTSATRPIDISKTYPTDNTTTFARGGHGLFSTAPDYLRSAQMLLNRGELDGERIISPAIADLMHTNHLASNPMPSTRKSSLESLFTAGFLTLPKTCQTYGWGLDA